MSDSFFTKPTQSTQAHVPGTIKEVLLHDPVSHMREGSFIAQPLSQLPSFLSIQPRSAIGNTAISQGVTIDMNLSSNDYLRNIVATFKVTNTSLVPVDYLSYATFDRVEILDSQNNILNTIWSTVFFDRFLFMNDLETNRLAIAENFNPANLGGITIAAGVTEEINLYIPSFITENVIRPDLVKTGITFRFYLSANCSNAPASLSISNFNLIVWGQRYYSLQSSLDLNIKSQEILRYRYLYAQRAFLNNAYTLNGGQQYNIQLVSGGGLNAFFTMRISNSVFNYTETLKYYPIENIQFNNASNTVVGIQMTNRQMQGLMNNYKQWPGKILDFNTIQAGSFSNLYVFSSTINPLLSETNVVGFFQLTGFESVQFTIPTTVGGVPWVNGTYKIELLAYNYAFAEIKDGMLTSTVSS